MALSDPRTVTYQSEGHTVWTWYERAWALVICCALLALWNFVVDPYVTWARGFLEAVLGIGILFSGWIAVVGRDSNDPD